MPCIGFRVQGLGFRVLGFRIIGLGGLGFIENILIQPYALPQAQPQRQAVRKMGGKNPKP